MQTSTVYPTFDAFYQASYPLILRRVYALLHHRQEAEDVTQDVFLKAFRAYPQLHLSPHGDRCLYRIATNAAYDALRRKRIVMFDSLEVWGEEPASSESPDPQESYTLGEQVHAALQQLPDQKQHALWLYHVGGYSAADLAAHYGRSLAWAKSYLHYATRAFREQYEAVQA